MVEQLIAQQQQVDPGLAHDRHVIGARRRQQPATAGDDRTGHRKFLADAAFLAPRPDVVAGFDPPGFQDVGRDCAVLAADHLVSASGNGSTGGDGGGFAGVQRPAGRPARQDLGDDLPRSRTGHGPAVHGGGVEARQVTAGDHRIGQRPADCCRSGTCSLGSRWPPRGSARIVPTRGHVRPARSSRRPAPLIVAAACCGSFPLAIAMPNR